MQAAAFLRPFFQERVQFFYVDEQMLGRARLGRGPGKRTYGIDQIGGIVMRAALVATVAVLVGRFALGTSSLDKAIGQKRARHQVVKLRHLALADQSGLADGGPDFLAHRPIFRAMGAAVVVEFDVESGKIADMGLAHGGDQFFLAYALLLGPDHYRRAVRVVRANINAAMAAELLKTNPNVGLQVLHQMSDVDMAVGIRQSAGDQDFSHIKFFSAEKAAAAE